MKRVRIWMVALATAITGSYPAQAVEPSPPTFAEHVASIVFEKCSSCHRPGQSGPFDLLTYADVKERAPTILAVVRDGYMPPWKLVSDDVTYAHDRRLSEQQKQILEAWIEADCPEGDPKKQPAIPDFPKDWQLGTPDLVVTMQGKYTVAADGPDQYRSFVFPIDLPEDKWVKAVEIKTSAKSALHHALFFVDPNGEARKLDGKDGRAGISGMGFLTRSNVLGSSGALGQSLDRGLGGYVPGATPALLPGDLARFLPKGSDVIMQTHFHPSGKVEVEQAQLALYFADKPPSRRLASIQLPPLFGRLSNLDIPAGEDNYLLEDEFEIPVAVQGIGVSGHAHYICRQMEMTAELPSGKIITLMKIDDWDLDWQDGYQFADAVDLPAGTIVRSKIVYDNSASNPENPNQPPVRIAWGRESTDEMGSITLQVVPTKVKDQAALQQAISAHLRTTLANRVRGGLGGKKSPSKNKSGTGGLWKRILPWIE